MNREAEYANRHNGHIPPEQRLTGGLVFGTTYETAQYLEPTSLPDNALTPEGQKTFAFAYYEDGLIYDNQENTYYYYTRGEDRSDMYKKLLEEEPEVKSPIITPENMGIGSEEFVSMVEEVKKRIVNGETFQSVVSRAEEYLIEGSLLPVYLELRKHCPSGNMHAVKMGEDESVGSFPELVIRIHNNEAIAYQVAGTRRLVDCEEQNRREFEGLITDPKDLAEHMMLVDLARNDLARFAVPGTVEVPEDGLKQRLNTGRVMHIATRVTARVNGASRLHMLMSVLPMGTVSGAPKIRSMNIISEQEKYQPRGLYAGSFGFIDASGNLEAVVGLRTVMRRGNKLKTQSGGGIVLDSDPNSEYEETVNKMRAVRSAIGAFIKDPDWLASA
tara:strand:+ start:20 stop:1180 length:1161 start_codon:yes stop_codon:yes gene_type:complete